MITEKKGFNRRTIFYNDEFKDEMRKFFDYINIDQTLDNECKNAKQRFSLAVRKMILIYNKRFGEMLTERSRARESGIQSSAKKITGY